MLQRNEKTKAVIVLPNNHFDVTNYEIIKS